MRTWLSPEGNVASVSPVGDLDVGAADELRRCLLDAVQWARRVVVVDLAQVGFLDSTALGVLIAASRRAQGRGAKLLLINADPHCERVIRMVGAASLLISAEPPARGLAAERR